MAEWKAFRELAAELSKIDVGVYKEHGRDPLQPILGLGDPHCRVAIMGRDPGRHEVEFGEPFIGAGGQLVRAALYRALHDGAEMPDFAASQQVGKHVFWMNTVPYKPVGNKAWGIRIQRRFQPLLADLLVNTWQGSDILALGRGAVMWFGLADKDAKAALADFWERDDRYETSLTLPLRASSGQERSFRIHPVPHPSPLNARWYRQVPELLDARLAALGFGPDSWRLDVR